jgi:hypothetical protein
MPWGKEGRLGVRGRLPRSAGARLPALTGGAADAVCRAMPGGGELGSLLFKGSQWATNTAVEEGDDDADFDF